jgi:proteic killer suppression protein
MIQSFADEETALIWSGRRSRRLPFDMQAIRVNDQRRICFAWREGGPADVQIVDYH